MLHRGVSGDGGAKDISTVMICFRGQHLPEVLVLPDGSGRPGSRSPYKTSASGHNRSLIVILRESALQ